MQWGDRCLWVAPSVSLTYQSDGSPPHVAGLALIEKLTAPVEPAGPGDLDRVTLVSSVGSDGLHRAVLDLDFPAAIVPSTTPGHVHLYLDKPTTWIRYALFLVGCGVAGYIEWTNIAVSLWRRTTMVRPPWVRKRIAAAGEDVTAEWRDWTRRR